MIKKPKDIRIALSYFGRGEYSRVIRLLEPKIPMYLEHKEFYTILAKSFFYTGDYSGSKLYFDRGQKIHWDIESSLYLAVLGVKRRDYNSSLRIWLDILDEDENNRVAKKGLEYLKRYSTMDELEQFIHSKKLDRLIPKRRVRLAPSTIISLSFVFILSLTVFILFKTNTMVKFFDIVNGNPTSRSILNRDGEEEFILSTFNNDYLDFSDQSIYSFTGEQIEDYFQLASDLFLEHKDNRVKSYLNLIKYSNANNIIKQRVDTLESYLVEPDWSNYSEDFSFKDIEGNLYQYENCIVKWKGRLSNLEIVDRKIHFSFLVGYDDGKVLEGVVPVELNENIKIQEHQPIEVLGRVTLRGNSFYIEALTIMQYIIKD